MFWQVRDTKQLWVNMNTAVWPHLMHVDERFFWHLVFLDFLMCESGNILIGYKL